MHSRAREALLLMTSQTEARTHTLARVGGGGRRHAHVHRPACPHEHARSHIYASPSRSAFSVPGRLVIRPLLVELVGAPQPSLRSPSRHAQRRAP
eukprot:2608502-Pleurochrysis_carterae.AAC.1